MSLATQIMDEIKNAMKAKDTVALESLRAVKSALLKNTVIGIATIQMYPTETRPFILRTASSMMWAPVTAHTRLTNLSAKVGSTPKTESRYAGNV